MNETNFDELAGRIDGIGQALLRVTAQLEMQEIIDGPRVSELWRQAAKTHPGDQAVHHRAHKTLLQLVQMLDDARCARQSMDHPE